MKDHLGEPIGARYLTGQIKLIEEAAAALKIQRCEMIRIDASMYAKKLLGQIPSH